MVASTIITSQAKRKSHISLETQVIAHKRSGLPGLVDVSATLHPEVSESVAYLPDSTCNNTLARAATPNQSVFYFNHNNSVPCISRGLALPRGAKLAFGKCTYYGEHHPNTTRLPPLVNGSAELGRQQVGVTSRLRVRRKDLQQVQS